MIRLFTTGGTFEKRYCPATFKMVIEESIIPEILRDARCSEAVQVERLLDKISYHFEESDYSRILSRCESCVEGRIVVTHGTTTMEKTAKMLSDVGLDKTIVLAGAMVPYTVRGSDAGFNLGFAISAATLLPAGVYIAMNGTIFDGTNVKKNRETGVYECLRPLHS